MTTLQSPLPFQPMHCAPVIMDMVIDAEALILSLPTKKKMYIVEQIAYVLLDENRSVIGYGHYFIEQKESAKELASRYSIDSRVVENVMTFYEHLTGDPPIHDDSKKASETSEDGETSEASETTVTYYKWSEVRKYIRALADRCRLVYAKGPQLETALFYNMFPIHDLSTFGCPAYPGAIHNPLDECFFFAEYVPSIHTHQ